MKHRLHGGCEINSDDARFQGPHPNVRLTKNRSQTKDLNIQGMKLKAKVKKPQC